MSNRRRVRDADFMLPSGAAEDLGRQDCLSLVIQSAFPLPSTGAFSDLVSAIDGDPDVSGGVVVSGVLPGKPSISVRR